MMTLASSVWTSLKARHSGGPVLGPHFHAFYLQLPCQVLTW